MMKYSVQLASLVLFFATFASGVAIGMEKELPSLPQDVKKIIANKTLRVILDEAQDDPTMLLEKQWRGPKSIMEAIYSFGWSQEKAPLIDTVLLLIQNGADVNTKNYEGNTILHLLLSAIHISGIIPEARTLTEMLTKRVEFSIARDRKLDSIMDMVQPKIEALIAKYKININAQNNKGNTIAHDIVNFIVKDELDILSKNWSSAENWFLRNNRALILMLWLSNPFKGGLDFRTIKNHNGKTACEILNSVDLQFPYTIIHEGGWSLICPSAFEKYEKHRYRYL
jgi:hypothetical protein